MTTPEISGTGDGGKGKPISGRSVAGDVAEAIADNTPKPAMAFFVKCIGIGLLIVCVGAAAAFVLYGGIFVNTDKEKSERKKIEIHKELLTPGVAGNTSSPVEIRK